MPLLSPSIVRPISVSRGLAYGEPRQLSDVSESANSELVAPGRIRTADQPINREAVPNLAEANVINQALRG